MVETATVIPSTARRYALDYDARGGKLLGIVLRNTLLAILTITLYRFWGQTRVRAYLWSGVKFLGDRFEYTGRPWELAIGFAIVVAVFLPLVVFYDFVVSIVWVEDEMAGLWASLVYPLLLIALIQIAIFRARRYRLSRTVWRGVRAGQTGSAIAYAFLALVQVLLMSVTVGLTLPLRNVALYRYRITNTWFGDQRFRFDGRGGRLLGIWFVCWLLFIPTLGMSYAWYKAAEVRYLSGTTSYAGIGFESEMTGWRLLGAWVPYIPAAIIAFILVGALQYGFIATAQDPTLPNPLYSVTFLAVFLTVWGIARLMVIHRFARLFCQCLRIKGEFDAGQIGQYPHTASKYGEGLADALDVGGL